MKKKGFMLIITCAIFTSLAMLGVISIEFISGNLTTTVQYASIPMLLAGLLIMMYRYRNKIKGGYSPFAELFRTGMYMTAMTALLFAISFAIFLSLYPGEIEALERMALTSNLPNRQFSPSAIRERQVMLGLFFTPTLIGVIKFFAVLVQGAILSLICAAIASRTHPTKTSN